MDRDGRPPEQSAVRFDDPTDAASEEYQRDILLVTTSATHEIIAEVLEAIHRIETGTYGICEATGLPIEPQRLRAVPWARYSLRGQKMVEELGLGRRASLPSVRSLRNSAELPTGSGEQEEEAS